MGGTTRAKRQRAYRSDNSQEVSVRMDHKFVWSVLALAAACSAETSDEVVRPPTGGEGKADVDLGSITQSPVALEFGGRIEGEFTRDLEFFGYRFRADSGADVSLGITQLGTAADLDTTLFVYGPETTMFSDELAFDDDSGWGAQSRIESLIVPEQGAYLVVVGTKTGRGRGTFGLELGCNAGDCVPPSPPEEAEETGLLFPVLDEDFVPLHQSHAAELEEAGLSDFPTHLFVTFDDDYTEMVSVLENNDIYPLAFALPEDYAGLCFRGDGAAIAGLTEALADDAFSDQYTLLASRFGESEYVAEWVQMDGGPELPVEWGQYDTESDAVLLVYAYTDSGSEAVPSLIPRCW